MVPICLALSVSPHAIGCGWAGDGELREDDGEWVIIGADGTPIADDAVSMENVAAFQNALGHRYRTGIGVPQDLVEAVRWYRKAAERGLAGAQNNLAGMYEQGLGVPQDHHAAARWYQKAAEQGEARSQHSLGLMYRDGLAFARDLSKAANWVRSAARQGHRSAMADLATMYWHGRGVPRNGARAYAWWKLAAARGDGESAEMRDTAAATLSPSELAEAERCAARWTTGQAC